MTTVVLGVGLGLGFVSWLRTRSPIGERRGYAAGLVVASALYLAFGVLSRGAPSWLLVEAGGVVIFSGIAWRGLTRSGWWFGAGWATHIVWDLALHGEGMASFVPGWYPLLCAGFDPVVAVAAGWRHRRLGRNLPGE